ncbi:MAG: hypothetical protein ACREJW_07060, partial [Candidatus Methylomirabilales bacterium]
MEDRAQDNNVGRFPLDRRKFLVKAASILGLAAAQALFPNRPAEAAEQPVAPGDPTRVPGAPPSAYGQRAAFE